MVEKVPEESEEQIAFVQWIKRNHPTALFFAIPNGGKRPKKTAATLKAEGVSSGVPDLCFPGINLFIEMKRQKGGRVEPNQKIWISDLRNAGWQVEICKGLEEAKRAFEIQMIWSEK